jgi:hypothetical protein
MFRSAADQSLIHLAGTDAGECIMLSIAECRRPPSAGGLPPAAPDLRFKSQDLPSPAPRNSRDIGFFRFMASVFPIWNSAMSQDQLDHAIARKTGETLRTFLLIPSGSTAWNRQDVGG